jgi:hypothetical protein
LQVAYNWAMDDLNNLGEQIKNKQSELMLKIKQLNELLEKHNPSNNPSNKVDRK